MEIIPAIDIMEGQCVRLSQGRKSEKTVYGTDPVAMAQRWVDQGARRLHIVDLDGAFSGEARSLAVISRILQAVSVPVEVGGGIRSHDVASAYLDAGASWVVVGTKAVSDPPFVGRLAESYPGQVLVGIDAKGGTVMVDGWVKESDLAADTLAHQMVALGAAGVIYTDISKDGMLSGPNVEATRALAEGLAVGVIASGGVSTLDHIRALVAVSQSGIIGVICGRSLYEGQFSLPEALALV